MIGELLQPKINWKELIHEFISDNSKNDYTWKRPNPRYSYQGMYLPYFDDQNTLEVVVAIDTSGSV